MKTRIITGDALRTLSDGWYWITQYKGAVPWVVEVTTAHHGTRRLFDCGYCNEIYIPTDKNEDLNLHYSTASEMQAIGPILPPIEFITQEG